MSLAATLLLEDNQATPFPKSNTFLRPLLDIPDSWMFMVHGSWFAVRSSLFRTMN